MKPNTRRGAMMRDLARLAVALGIVFAVAAIGGVLTAPAIKGWYQALVKPSWTPPDWLFGPVWTVLYTLMGVAVWLVWRRKEGTSLTLPLTAFAVQLALNLAWSAIFFFAHQPGWAMLEIVCLWLAVLGTTMTFWRVSATAGALLVPYLLWVSYACTLNFGIWRLNR